MYVFAFYLTTIVGGNIAFAALGVVPVGFGLMAPAAVYFVGLSLVLRDILQDRLGWRAAFLAIILGAALSAIVNPQLAIASGVAFLLSETIDLLVYTPLRRRGFLRAVVVSNAAGLVVDSVVFLALAFGSLAFLPGQLLAKSTATLGAVGVLAALRRQAR